VSRLSIEVRWWIGLLLVLQLLMSFAWIGLLARVSPAVSRILRENEFSVEAVESMLAVLASEEGAVSQDGRASFTQALVRARGNVTEEEEVPLLESLERLAPEALAGDEDAREQIVEALRSLAEVNRTSMREADQDAQRIGGGGAWAAAFAGITGFGLGVLVLNRLLNRLVVPVLQVDAALDNVRRGDPHRRCLPLVGPTEIMRIGENLNWLLDEHSRSEVPTGASTIEALRIALLAQIDRDARPVVIVSKEGIVAMNAAAYAQAELQPSPTVAALAARLGWALPEGWTATALVDGQVWSCVRES
jgi:hypothetical protein